MQYPASPVAGGHRVVITGAGIVTALGIGWSSNAAGFRAGRTAFRPVSLFDTSRQRVRVAGEVDLPAAIPTGHLPAREATRLDRASRLLLLAADEAWRQSGWNTSSPLPVVLGTTSGGMAQGEAFYRQASLDPPHRCGQAVRVSQYMAHRQGLNLLSALDCEGPITIIANACASGANAIGHAFELVHHGAAERVLAGGYDALSHLVFAGFDSLQALSPTRCRPFDQRRDGLALGEGAAVLALESLDHARHRDAVILGEVAGYGRGTDLHHLTQPNPEGRTALATMRAACACARLPPERIGYLNAHGTGTPLNDAAEATAINEWAGAAAPHLAVSSTKGSIGHLLGAAGAVEAIVCLMSLRERWLPPSAGLEQPDPLCRFRLVRTPEDLEYDHALTNSFGFGGANATLILKRWP